MTKATELFDRVIALAEKADNAPFISEAVTASEAEGETALYAVLDSAPRMARALKALWPALEEYSSAFLNVTGRMPSIPAEVRLGNAEHELLAAFETAKKELEGA